MIDRTLIQAVFAATNTYPRLRWRVEDGYSRLRSWYEDQGHRFVEEPVMPPDPHKRATTVVCSIGVGERELSTREDISDVVASGYVRGHYYTHHILERLVAELAREYFKQPAEIVQTVCTEGAAV